MNTEKEPKLSEIVDTGTELETLKALRLKLAKTIDESRSGRDIAALSRQLRKVSATISELEKESDTDEITALLEERKTAGKAGAVRENKTNTMN